MHMSFYALLYSEILLFVHALALSAACFAKSASPGAFCLKHGLDYRWANLTQHSSANADKLMQSVNLHLRWSRSKTWEVF
jgi:hypothetical protein